MVLPTILLAAGAAFTLAVPAPRPASTPVAPARYKLVTSAKQVTDLSGLGGDTQEMSFTSTTWFQLEVRDSAGGRVAHVIVDSLQMDDAQRAQAPAGAADSARGAEYHAFIAADGNVTLTPVKAGGPMGRSAANSIVDLVPRTRGALAAGREWSDTTSSTRATGNGSRTSKTITNYSAESATVLKSAYASSLTGTQESPSGTVTTAGTATGKAAWTFGADQAIESMTRTEEVKLQATIAVAPAPIPVTLNQEVTLTRVR